MNRSLSESEESRLVPLEIILRQAGEQVLNIARQKGIEAEAFLLHGRELGIEVIDGRMDTLKEAEEMGMGLRIINGGRLGFVYSSDLSISAIEEAVDHALKISRYTVADEHNRLPEGNFTYPVMELFDDKIVSTSLEAKIEMARQIERVARSVDSRVRIIERSGYDDHEFTAVIMNTHGLYAAGRANSCGLYIFLVAEENNDAQNGFSFMSRKRIQDLNPDIVGQEAARRALRSLNARSINSAPMPCLMEPYVTTRFLALTAQIVDAEAVQKGKSLWEQQIQKQVASQHVSLVDDATCAQGIAAFPFDGEGVPAQRNMVIKDGVLQTFLYDSYTASKAGVKSTGNGQRGSFRSLPGVGTSNFMLQPGHQSPDQLISEVARGFYVTEVMGMHTANPISGDFSLGASGVMIENGSLTYPVRGVTIAGNMVNFFKDIEALGNDLCFFGSRAAPTIRLNSMSIAGN
ncbi:MAG: TldD/PmbA family protein [Syntrophomonas sp.]